MGAGGAGFAVIGLDDGICSVTVVEITVVEGCVVGVLILVVVVVMLVVVVGVVVVVTFLLGSVTTFGPESVSL